MGSIELLVNISTLREYGVDRIFFLENDNVDSSQRNVLFLARSEKPKTVQAIAGMVSLISLAQGVREKPDRADINCDRLEAFHKGSQSRPSILSFASQIRVAQSVLIPRLEYLALFYKVASKSCKACLYQERTQRIPVLTLFPTSSADKAYSTEQQQWP